MAIVEKNDYGCFTLLKKENIKIDDRVFYRMLCPESEEFSQFYLGEEEQQLRNFIQGHENIKDMNFIVVGAGPLLHVTLGLEHAKCYLAVDPLSHLFLNDIPQDMLVHNRKVKISNKYFEALDKDDIPPGKSVYIFTFNVISYIKNFVAVANKIIKKGDILFLSYWNNCPENEGIISNYFSFVYGKNFATQRNEMIDTQHIDYQKIKHLREVSLYCGSVIKTMIIYT